jgi:hypothetical protein
MPPHKDRPGLRERAPGWEARNRSTHRLILLASQSLDFSAVERGLSRVLQWPKPSTVRLLNSALKGPKNIL